MGQGGIHHDIITLGTSRKHSYGLIWASWASGGQIKQTMVRMKGVYGTLEQVGSVQRGQK